MNDSGRSIPRGGTVEAMPLLGDPVNLFDPVGRSPICSPYSGPCGSNDPTLGIPFDPLTIRLPGFGAGWDEPLAPNVVYVPNPSPLTASDTGKSEQPPTNPPPNNPQPSNPAPTIPPPPSPPPQRSPACEAALISLL